MLHVAERSLTFQCDQSVRGALFPLEEKNAGSELLLLLLPPSPRRAAVAAGAALLERNEPDKDSIID